MDQLQSSNNLQYSLQRYARIPHRTMRNGRIYPTMGDSKTPLQIIDASKSLTEHIWGA